MSVVHGLWSVVCRQFEKPWKGDLFVVPPVSKKRKLPLPPSRSFLGSPAKFLPSQE